MTVQENYTADSEDMSDYSTGTPSSARTGNDNPAVGGCLANNSGYTECWGVSRHLLNSFR